MPKSTQILKTIGKTINLAKPQVYQVPRKPPLNSLVFEKLPEPRCGDRIALKNVPPAPKPVRICTKEELQALYCCPTPCDCQLKCKPPSTLAHRIVKALLLITKSMIVGALVYYTWAEGLWSDSEHSRILTFMAKVMIIKEMIRISWKEGLWSDAFHSSCLLSKFVERCPPEEEEEENEYANMEVITIRDPEPCLPFIPRSDILMYQGALYWNKVVKLFFWIILEGPWEFLMFLLDLARPKPKKGSLDPCDEIRNMKRNP